MTDRTTARRFEGRTAVVTGASRGIGLAIAQRLVDEGARVVVTARKPEALEEAVASLGGPEHALAVAGKADDVAHQEETLARAAETFGPVDVLVNNAGINPTYGPLVDLEPAAARKTVEVNDLAMLSWTRLAMRASFAERGGSVVNVASVSGLLPSDGIGMYGASKAMAILLTKQLAVELAPAVRVNAVAPAVVKTRFAAKLYEHDEEGVAAAYPLQRLGRPEDVAAAVAYLASDDASWVTGQVLTLDGGRLLTGGV